MTPAAFRRALAELELAGVATTDRAAAEALGLHPNTIATMRRKGADRRTALACAALLAGLEPVTEDTRK